MIDPDDDRSINISTHIGNTMNSSLTITNVVKSFTGYYWLRLPSVNVCNVSLTVHISKYKVASQLYMYVDRIHYDTYNQLQLAILQLKTLRGKIVEFLQIHRLSMTVHFENFNETQLAQQNVTCTIIYRIFEKSVNIVFTWSNTATFVTIA